MSLPEYSLGQDYKKTELDCFTVAAIPKSTSEMLSEVSHT